MDNGQYPKFPSCLCKGKGRFWHVLPAVAALGCLEVESPDPLELVVANVADLL